MQKCCNSLQHFTFPERSILFFRGDRFFDQTGQPENKTALNLGA